MTVFVAFFLPLVVSLGLWQLDRAAQKAQMREGYLASLAALPMSSIHAKLDQPFTRLRLQGRYREEAYLVDNQVSDGQVGYWVIQGFDTAEGQRVLVNRGFIAAPSDRAVLPTLSTPSDAVSVIGISWPFTGLVPLLEEDAWSDEWPKRVQRLNVARMGDVLGAVPVEIRLEPGQPGVLKAAPFAARMKEATHLGYAATWFGLGFALVVLFVWFGLKNGRQIDDN